MMKIGIITYHRSHNYGALLQAYGLKSYLQSIGYDVNIVDYFPHYHKQMYMLWPWSYFKTWSLKRKIDFIRNFPFTVLQKRKRRDLFEKFINIYLQPIPVNLQEKYDVLIYGSDQIWRYQDTPIYKGYNKVYFGSDEIPAKRRITYSASMGNMDRFDSNIDFLQTMLKNFDAVAVREKDLFNKVQLIYSKEVSLTLDPVFLLSKVTWEGLVPERKLSERYILLYNLLSDPKLNLISNQLSKKMGIKIIEITGGIRRQASNEVMMINGPLEFLSWVYHAECIVTSSFHGVAFSILFQKPFFTYLPNNSARVLNLLDELGLEKLFIKENHPDFIEIDFEIDYNDVGKRLNKLIARSRAYLDSSI